MEYHVEVRFRGGEFFTGEVKATSSHDAVQSVIAKMLPHVKKWYRDTEGRLCSNHLVAKAGRRLDLWDGKNLIEWW